MISNIYELNRKRSELWPVHSYINEEYLHYCKRNTFYTFRSTDNSVVSQFFTMDFYDKVKPWNDYVFCQFHKSCSNFSFRRNKLQLISSSLKNALEKMNTSSYQVIIWYIFFRLFK